MFGTFPDHVALPRRSLGEGWSWTELGLFLGGLVLQPCRPYGPFGLIREIRVKAWIKASKAWLSLLKATKG
jgi:hypothetical protein